jgi:hypothetical protein
VWLGLLWPNERRGWRLKVCNSPVAIAEGTELTRMGGLESLLRSQYSPTQFQRMDAQAPQLQRYGMQAAQTGFRPDLQFYQIGAPAERGTPMMTAAQTGFRPQLEGAGEFTGATAQKYMSPYMQQVVEVQKQKAIEDAQKTQLAQNLGAARQGTYGGARQLLAATEREKALGEQLGQIQATGTQAAYEQAAQQFERDRTAKLQVQALETDVGLKTALANLDSNQQAAVQNQAAQLQMQGLNADQALRIALANQQASLGVQQLGTETGLRTALANLDAESQSRVQNLAAELEVQGMGATQALQAALANQQKALWNSKSFLNNQGNLLVSLGLKELGQQAPLVLPWQILELVKLKLKWQCVNCSRILLVKRKEKSRLDWMRPMLSLLKSNKILICALGLCPTSCVALRRCKAVGLFTKHPKAPHNSLLVQGYPPMLCTEA